MSTQKLPSDALTKPIRRAPWIVGGIAAVSLAASAMVFGPAIAGQLNPAPRPSPTVQLIGEDVADVPVPPSPTYVERAQEVAASQAAAALLAQQQADAAAAEVAAAAAKSTTPHSTSAGPVRCPAGSSANSNDGVNDTSCFPDICSHIQVPDPEHPECDASFKP